MKFDSATFDQFRKDLATAVKSVEEKYDLKLEAGSIRYDDLGFSMPTNWKRIDIDAAKIKFERDCGYYGFQPEDYRREFSANGKRYVLIGFASKSPKYSCICEEAGGSSQPRFTAESVKRAFLIQPKK